MPDIPAASENHDLVAALCTGCGAGLRINPYHPTAKCGHCKTEFIIQNGLRAYARLLRDAEIRLEDGDFSGARAGFETFRKDVNPEESRVFFGLFLCGLSVAPNNSSQYRSDHDLLADLDSPLPQDIQGLRSLLAEGTLYSPNMATKKMLDRAIEFAEGDLKNQFTIIQRRRDEKEEAIRRLYKDKVAQLRKQAEHLRKEADSSRKTASIIQGLSVGIPIAAVVLTFIVFIIAFIVNEHGGGGMFVLGLIFMVVILGAIAVGLGFLFFWIGTGIGVALSAPFSRRDKKCEERLKSLRTDFGGSEQLWKNEIGVS